MDYFEGNVLSFYFSFPYLTWITVWYQRIRTFPTKSLRARRMVFHQSREQNAEHPNQLCGQRGRRVAHIGPNENSTWSISREEYACRTSTTENIFSSTRALYRAIYSLFLMWCLTFSRTRKRVIRRKTHRDTHCAIRFVSVKLCQDRVCTF